MAYHLADMLPSPTVFAYLSDETLEAVQSDEFSSVYQYRCGCVAVRWLRSVHCYVRWCALHSPTTSDATP
jgi:hypothetical protein